MKEQQLLEAGQKLLGLITNLRHETDYLPDFYYEWMDRLISETDEILTDEIDIASLPEGQTDTLEPFQSWEPEGVKEYAKGTKTAKELKEQLGEPKHNFPNGYSPITKESYDGI